MKKPLVVPIDTTFRGNRNKALKKIYKIIYRKLKYFKVYTLKVLNKTSIFVMINFVVQIEQFLCYFKVDKSFYLTHFRYIDGINSNYIILRKFKYTIYIIRWMKII